MQISEVAKMCRYALKTYKPHFACFDCRKVFKKTPIEDYLKQRGDDFAYWQLVKSIRWKKNKVKGFCYSKGLGQFLLSR
jgi:uncharacterized FAD-dependent dehydrogenase